MVILHSCLSVSPATFICSKNWASWFFGKCYEHHECCNPQIIPLLAAAWIQGTSTWSNMHAYVFSLSTFWRSNYLELRSFRRMSKIASTSTHSTLNMFFLYIYELAKDNIPWEFVRVPMYSCAPPKHQQLKWDEQNLETSNCVAVVVHVERSLRPSCL